jgi:hypothetical protein
MRNYARIFADRLTDDRNHLEADQDQEGDEEDGGQCFIPLDLQCILYSDLNQVKTAQKAGRLIPSQNSTKPAGRY